LETVRAKVRANPAIDAEVGVTKTTTPVKPMIADDSRLNLAETQRETAQERTVSELFASACVADIEQGG